MDCTSESGPISSFARSSAPALLTELIDLGFFAFHRDREQRLPSRRVLEPQIQPQLPIAQRKVRAQHYFVAAEILTDTIQSLAAVAVCILKRKAELHFRYALARNGAQLVPLAQFGGEHLGERRRKPRLLRPSRKILEAQHRNGATAIHLWRKRLPEVCVRGRIGSRRKSIKVPSPPGRQT